MEMQISDEEKLFLFNAMFANEYDELIQIDLDSGMASTIHASDPIWYPSVSVHYPFEPIMHRFITDNCADLHPEKILQKLTLRHIAGELEKHHVYSVYFTYREEPEEPLRMEAVSFYRVGHFQTLMTIRDVTDGYDYIRTHLKELT